MHRFIYGGDMNPLKRRDFLRWTTVMLGTRLLPLQLSACAGFSPEPFVVGDEVEAPHGCKVLRAENPAGDC